MRLRLVAKRPKIIIFVTKLDTNEGMNRGRRRTMTPTTTMAVPSRAFARGNFRARGDRADPAETAGSAADGLRSSLIRTPSFR
jgi:hypothetical protein